MSSNEMNQSKFPPRGWATRFKNQFDMPVYFHAFGNKEKAIEDAGRAGEVVPFISLAEHNHLISQLEERLRVAELKAWKDVLNHLMGIGHFGGFLEFTKNKIKKLAAIKEKQE